MLRVRLSVIYALQAETAVDVAVVRDLGGQFVPHTSASMSVRGRERVDLPIASMVLLHEGCIHAGSAYQERNWRLFCALTDEGFKDRELGYITSCP